MAAKAMFSLRGVASTRVSTQKLWKISLQKAKPFPWNDTGSTSVGKRFVGVSSLPVGFGPRPPTSIKASPSKSFFSATVSFHSAGPVGSSVTTGPM
eukprot:9517996-Alexandrium_andersonii.AAC.1